MRAASGERRAALPVDHLSPLAEERDVVVLAERPVPLQQLEQHGRRLDADAAPARALEVARHGVAAVVRAGLDEEAAAARPVDGGEHLVELRVLVRAQVFELRFRAVAPRRLVEDRAAGRGDDDEQPHRGGGAAHRFKPPR